MGGLQTGWSGRVSLKRALEGEREPALQPMGEERALGGNRGRPGCCRYMGGGAQGEAGKEGRFDKQFAFRFCKQPALLSEILPIRVVLF